MAFIVIEKKDKDPSEITPTYTLDMLTQQLPPLKRCRL